MLKQKESSSEDESLTKLPAKHIRTKPRKVRWQAPQESTTQLPDRKAIGKTPTRHGTNRKGKPSAQGYEKNTTI